MYAVLVTMNHYYLEYLNMKNQLTFPFLSELPYIIFAHSWLVSDKVLSVKVLIKLFSVAFKWYF